MTPVIMAQLRQASPLRLAGSPVSAPPHRQALAGKSSCPPADSDKAHSKRGTLSVTDGAKGRSLAQIALAAARDDASSAGRAFLKDLTDVPPSQACCGPLHPITVLLRYCHCVSMQHGFLHLVTRAADGDVARKCAHTLTTRIIAVMTRTNVCIDGLKGLSCVHLSTDT